MKDQMGGEPLGPLGEGGRFTHRRVPSFISSFQLAGLAPSVVYLAPFRKD